MKKKIYLDNAATTRMHPEVLAVMKAYMEDYYGNPAGVYELSRISKDAMDETRRNIAGMLRCRPEEIFFTSGGTESDNWAIKGSAYANKERGKHIITTSIEHHAVLRSCEFLETQGFSVTYLPVDEKGMVSVQEVVRAIRKDTILISVMFANNEIGTIQPIREIGLEAKKRRILFHTDAVQAFGQLPISVDACGADLLSASAHKFGGPKGIGFLYIRNQIPIDPFMHGGSQESGMRAGTGNVPGAAGMGKAVVLCGNHMAARIRKEQMLRDYLIKKLQYTFPGVVINGHLTNRLPGNVSAAFPGYDGDSIVRMLDREGICTSTGSACSAGFKNPSHVLNAIGLPDELLFGTVRFTISYDNTKEELDQTIVSLKKVLTALDANR